MIWNGCDDDDFVCGTINGDTGASVRTPRMVARDGPVSRCTASIVLQMHELPATSRAINRTCACAPISAGGIQ